MHAKSIKIAPLLFNVGTRSISEFNITPRPLEPPTRTPLPIRKNILWVPQPVWPFGRIEKYLSIVELQIADSPVGSLVSMSNSGYYFIEVY